MECDESLHISTSSTAAIMQSSNVSGVPTRAIVRQAFAVWLATRVVLAVDLLGALSLARGLGADNEPGGERGGAWRGAYEYPPDRRGRGPIAILREVLG